MAVSAEPVVLARLQNGGLANRLFPWARAIVYSKRFDLGMLPVRWQQAKVGPLLRRETDLRLYLSQLTQAFARIYLGNARDVLSSITFVHGVTSAAALRSLLPLLDAAAARELVRHTWHAGAALYVSLGTAPLFLAARVNKPSPTLRVNALPMALLIVLPVEPSSTDGKQCRYPEGNRPKSKKLTARSPHGDCLSQQYLCED